MKSLTLLSLLSVASAHTRFTTLFINSHSQGDGTCIRMNMDPSTTTGFVNGITSQDMACGVGGGEAVERTCPAKAGDSIALLHRAWADGAQPGSIDPSHKGSNAIYMKKVADAGSLDPWGSSSASGDGWFKIMWDGYDEGASKWGTEKMIANDGLVSATIPSDLAGGYYLIRSEALALQNVVDEHVNPQFYVGCAQVYLEGTSSVEPSATVAIPGYVDDSTPAMSYNIYKQTPPAAPFDEFGPAVYGGGSSVSDKASEGAGTGSKVSVSTDTTASSSGASTPATSTSPFASVDALEPTDNPVVPDTPAAPDTPAVPDTPAISATSSTVSIPFPSAPTNPSNDNTWYTWRNHRYNKAHPRNTNTLSKKSPSPQSSTSAPTNFIGTCPPSTILEVANQCLPEIPAWTADTPGSLPKCWAASQACWDNSDTCWAHPSPAVNAGDKNVGCNLYNERCLAIVAWCEGGNLEGPPGEGRVLTPKKGVLGRREEKGRRDVAGSRELVRRILEAKKRTAQAGMV